VFGLSIPAVDHSGLYGGFHPELPAPPRDQSTQQREHPDRGRIADARRIADAARTSRIAARARRRTFTGPGASGGPAALARCAARAARASSRSTRSAVGAYAATVTGAAGRRAACHQPQRHEHGRQASHTRRRGRKNIVGATGAERYCAFISVSLALKSATLLLSITSTPVSMFRSAGSAALAASPLVARSCSHWEAR
jgi:hypothetical protein